MTVDSGQLTVGIVPANDNGALGTARPTNGFFGNCRALTPSRLRAVHGRDFLLAEGVVGRQPVGHASPTTGCSTAFDLKYNGIIINGTFYRRFCL